MTVFILGLGLMGSAYAKRLSSQGVSVFGWDLDDATRAFHEEKDYLKVTSLTENTNTDILIVALSPQKTLSFFKEHAYVQNNFTLITDLSGLKNPLHNNLNPAFLWDNYLSHHPMTGASSEGFKGLDEVVFKNKNVIGIHKPVTQSAKKLLENLVLKLEMNQITYMEALVHDEIITLNSHIPHVVASVLTHQKQLDLSIKNAGNSFQSLISYAHMNPTLWSELLTLNKNLVKASILKMIDELNTFKDLLNHEDQLKKYLKDGAMILMDIEGSHNGH